MAHHKCDQRHQGKFESAKELNTTVLGNHEYKIVLRKEVSSTTSASDNKHKLQAALEEENIFYTKEEEISYYVPASTANPSRENLDTNVSSLAELV